MRRRVWSLGFVGLGVQGLGYRAGIWFGIQVLSFSDGVI